MTQTLVATPDPPPLSESILFPTPITEESFMEALRALVEFYGEDRTSAYESMDYDRNAVSQTVTHDHRGVLARIIRYHGISGRQLQALGDFMVFGDFNCTPSGLFHLTGDTRKMAMMVESLEELGHTWGSIQSELEAYLEADRGPEA